MIDRRRRGRAVEPLIADGFGLDIAVVVRSRAELAQVIEGNPFPEAVSADPKRLQVSFLSGRLAADVADHVSGLSSDEFSLDTESLSVAPSGREVYGWHPTGIHASALARELSDRKLGVTATARNWRTVTTLLDMAIAVNH